MIIQETTENWDPPDCIPARIAAECSEVIADYRLQNSKTWTLESRLNIDVPYRLVSKKAILAPFEEGTFPDWPAFHRAYPGSGGYHVISAVGFNAAKTRALISAGGVCGGLCGSHGFYFFERVGGVWHRSKPMGTCFVTS